MRLVVYVGEADVVSLPVVCPRSRLARLSLAARHASQRPATEGNRSACDTQQQRGEDHHTGEAWPLHLQRVGHQLAVVVTIAPGELSCLLAAEEELDYVLLREADAAVDLLPVGDHAAGRL